MSGASTFIAFPAAHQRRGPAGVPVAASMPEKPVIDPRTVLSLGSACRRAAVAFAYLSNEFSMEDYAAGLPMSDRALETAQRAFDLESAAQHLQAQAQDAELQAYLRHRAAGGVVILKDAPRAECVVVGDAPLAAAAANDRPTPGAGSGGWLAAASRFLRLA